MTQHKWNPYCYEDGKCRSYSESDKIKPGHGSCCTCQKCGYDYDNCICQYFEEPCTSCKYKKGFQSSGRYWKPYDPNNPPVSNLTPKQQENHRKMVEDLTGRHIE